MVQWQLIWSEKISSKILVLELILIDLMMIIYIDLF